MLSVERDMLRQELHLFEKTIYKTFIAIVTITIAFTGILTETINIDDKNIRIYTLITINQIHFFCMLFGLALWNNIGVHTEYISALEIRINEIFKYPVSIWENEIAPKFINSHKNIGYWTHLIFSFGLITTYIGCAIYIYTIIRKINISIFFIPIVLGELVCIVLLIIINIKSSNATEHALKILGRVDDK